MVEREVKFTSPCSSSSSSSPIPVSVGAGDEAYMFSSSSPPFSPASSPPSPEATSILLDKDFTKLGSTFSLDWSSNLQESDSPTSPSSCLRDLLEWLLIRCCKCCCYGGFDFIKETKQRQEASQWKLNITFHNYEYPI